MNEIKSFQFDCQHYIVNYHENIKWLYWELIPKNYVGKDLNVKIEITDAEWVGQPEVNDVSLPDEFEREKDYKQFKQTCGLILKVSLKSGLLIPPQYLKTEVQFTANYLKPDLRSFHIFVSTSYSRTFGNFQAELLRLQNRFDLKSIEGSKLNSQTSFGFFCDVIRKSRIIQAQNRDVGNGSYFCQIAHAHEELATAISNLLIYFPFLSKLTDRRVVHENDELFLPVSNVANYKFYFWCSICVERLYTFWETLIVILYNFDTLSIKLKRLSFSHYFDQADKNSNFIFDKTSANYNWLKNFADSNYKDGIVKYRHRIVHHEFTNEHEGLLSAKFYINAYENVGNKSQLEKLQAEINAFPQLMIKHFNHCKEGFEKALLLIDELA